MLHGYMQFTVADQQEVIANIYIVETSVASSMNNKVPYSGKF